MMRRQRTQGAQREKMMETTGLIFTVSRKNHRNIRKPPFFVIFAFLCGHSFQIRKQTTDLHPRRYLQTTWNGSDDGW
jgi:hypothetical protein